MIQLIGELIFIYVVVFIITFISLFFLVKHGSKILMKFLGADFFMFDLKKRMKMITIISAILALVLTIVLIIAVV